MIKAIIFDFDGVLVDSVDVKTNAFAKLFEVCGPEIVEQVVEHHLINGGMSRFEKIKYYYSEFLKKPLSESELELLCGQFAEMVVNNVINAPMIKGAKEFLDSYHKKYSIFVVSGTPENELKKIVKEREMNHFFEGVFGSPIDKITHVSTIIDKNKLKKSEILFVGDAITDYKAAQAAKVHFIGRVDFSSKNPFPKDTKIISNLTELETSIINFD